MAATAQMNDTETSSARIQSFDDFWPFYLSEHRNPFNRALHFAGTTMALAAAASSVVLGPQMIPAALVCGYGPAWIGHFFIEKNRPASFKYPAWSFRADFKMYGMMWQRKLGDELARHGIG